MQRSPNFKKGRFVNLFRIRRIRVVRALGKFLRARKYRLPRTPIPVVKRTRADFTVPSPGGLRVTWINHSTMLVELDGRRFLTDPIWSRRAGPTSVLGTKRFFEPPIALPQLPPLDAVVISHDHYDHLDMATIRSLARTPTKFVVPLGVGAHLERWGVAAERIVELDWWERTSVRGVTLTATPARHGSGRSLVDRNATLWASWAMVGPRHRVFFSGDGGYSPSFSEIGRRLGPFDVTLMEIGAYDALWSDFHMGPEQSVQAHRELGGRLMLPSHWSTFSLAPHGWTEPAERLWAAARRHRVAVAIPRPGQSVDPTAPPAVTRWWPNNPWQTAAEAPVVSSRPAGYNLVTRDGQRPMKSRTQRETPSRIRIAPSHR
ncbi:MAG: MBL fold metallo-hydrolase [bacterium]